MAAPAQVVGGNTTTNTPAVVKDDKDNKTDVPSDNSQNGSNSSEEVKEPETTKEPEKPTPQLYDRVAEWDRYYKDNGGYFGAVQLEDIFIYPGMTGKELFEAIASSKDTLFTSESTVEKLIPAAIPKALEMGTADLYLSVSIQNYEVSISFKRDERVWFTVQVVNLGDDIQPLSDCYVTSVRVNEDCLPYARFFDGKYSYDDLCALSYKDYDTFSQQLTEAGYTVSKNDYIWEICTDSKTPISESLSDSNPYQLLVNKTINLQISADTGKVSDLSYAPDQYSDAKLYYTYIGSMENYDYNSSEYVDLLIQETKKSYNLDENIALELVETRVSKNGFCTGVTIFGKIYYIRFNNYFVTRSYDENQKVTYYVLEYVDLVVAGTDKKLRGLNGKAHEGTYKNLGMIESYLEVKAALDGKSAEVKGVDEYITYMYRDDLITEIKKVASFDDITAAGLDAVIQNAIYNEVKGKTFSWDPMTNISPYIIFIAKDNKDVYIDFTIYGETSNTKALYDIWLYNPQWNVEAGRLTYQEMGSTGGDTNAEEYYKAIRVTFTTVDGQQVMKHPELLERLPLSYVNEMVALHPEYSFIPASIDNSK